MDDGRDALSLQSQGNRAGEDPGKGVDTVENLGTSFTPSANDESGSDEQSPLLGPETSNHVQIGRSISLTSLEQWKDSDEETKSSWYLLLLTLGSLGLQVGWSVETSNGSPYLLSLGLSKSMLALVWIAGPLSGVLVQPYVGVKSDRCQSRFGKRKPFIVGGCVATILSLLLLAWARELVQGFVSIFGVAPETRGVKVCVMILAVILVYVLDFAINVLQAAIRAFIVDCAPTKQQNTANAWASRLQGVGNIFGYICGFVKLRDILPFLGNSQFKVLCAIASLMIALTSGISVSYIREGKSPARTPSRKDSEGVTAFFKSLFRSLHNLPPQVAQVCWVQFAAWIGWFPFLFYVSTYVGEIYTQPFFEKNPHMKHDAIEELWEEATRVGTFALLIFAITTFLSSILLPLLIQPQLKAVQFTENAPLTPTTLSVGDQTFVHSPVARFSRRDSQVSHRPKSTSWSSSSLEFLQIPHLTLRRLWLISHILFATAMLLSFFVSSVTGATILVGFIGLPWSVTNWAPFALISTEISKRAAIRRVSNRLPMTREPVRDDSSNEDEPGAGVVLGIHNVAISAPQVIATIVSSAIFWALQKPRGTPGDHSIAWTLRFAGVCALLAAWLTRRVGEEDEKTLVTDASTT